METGEGVQVGAVGPHGARSPVGVGQIGEEVADGIAQAKPGHRFPHRTHPRPSHRQVSRFLR